MAEMEKILNKEVKESKKKRLTVDCKKTRMHACQQKREPKL